MTYDVVPIDLGQAGRLVLQDLPAATNTISAAVPSGGVVYARLGRAEAPRINLAVRPLLKVTCGGFGLVVLEWEELAGGVAEIMLSADLDSAVVVPEA